MGLNEGQTCIYKGSDSNVTWVDDLSPHLGKVAKIESEYSKRTTNRN